MIDERRESIEYWARLVGNDEAERLWRVVREPPPPGAPKPDIDDVIPPALRAWLAHRGHTDHAAALAIVADTIDLVTGLESLLVERYGWLALWLREALAVLREEEADNGK